MHSDSLVVKEKCGKVSKSLKTLWHWLSVKFGFVYVFTNNSDIIYHFQT